MIGSWLLHVGLVTTSDPLLGSCVALNLLNVESGSGGMGSTKAMSSWLISHSVETRLSGREKSSEFFKYNINLDFS